MLRIETSCGPVRGRAVAGTRRFEGIPYAAAPIATRRLAPPVPPSPWITTRACDAPTAAPPQRRGGLLGTRPVADTDEACLHLNVITPAAAAALPVMVWIHGGGFTNGFAADPIHDGTRLVSRGELVLVTFDYRLGLLGQLHGAAPEHGNLALRDQLLALTWVQDNIRAFGGDPSRVTLFGESAGAMSIRALLATPRADPLYARVALQSVADGALQSTEDAAATRAAVHERVGNGDLRTLDVEAILDLQQAVDDTRRAQTGRGAWRPLRDGELITRSDSEALTAALARGVRVMIGSNADEQRLFVNLRRAPEPDQRDRAARRVLRSLGVPAAEHDRIIRDALAHYGAEGDDPVAAQGLAALLTDAYYRLPVLRVAAACDAAGAPAFVYRFDWASPALKGRLGACHALEIPFVFGTLDAPGMARFAGVDDAAWRLSDAMIDAWSAFARGQRALPASSATELREHPPAADSEPAAAGVPAKAPWTPWTRSRPLCWIADREPRVAEGIDETCIATWTTLLARDCLHVDD